MVAFFGDKAAAEAALKLETMGRENKLAKCPDEWEALKARVDQIARSLPALVEGMKA
jgi:hypothetical protein